ncbi:MAG: invasion associated locus B family protein [Aestuariivirga sp.]|uniref:invasion associated locus B family protein n=1 Tax=Aestuariivirga sp. TaxID=2650926 RepID=UPI0038D18A38
MRITLQPLRWFTFAAASLTLGVWLGGLAVAQETQKQDAQTQFGPRANKQAGQTADPGQPAAQPGQPPAPKVEIIAENGAWKVTCETPPAAEGQQPQRQCGMVQSAKNEKNPRAQLTLVLVKVAQGDKTGFNMRVIAPIGVFLPTGVALEIDGEAVGRVPFTRCMPQVCMAFAEASPETIAKMKKGKEANFIIYEAPGVGLPMKLSLEGFSASLAELEKT